MTYLRVIPRDLFNEANLLKCYGQLYLELERLNIPGVELDHNCCAFRIEQDPSDGAIFIANVLLRRDGVICSLLRPLNSRKAWPLYLHHDGWDDVAVFNDDGTLSDTMHKFLRGIP